MHWSLSLQILTVGRLLKKKAPVIPEVIPRPRGACQCRSPQHERLLPSFCSLTSSMMVSTRCCTHTSTGRRTKLNSQAASSPASKRCWKRWSTCTKGSMPCTKSASLSSCALLPPPSAFVFVFVKLVFAIGNAKHVFANLCTPPMPSRLHTPNAVHGRVAIGSCYEDARLDWRLPCPSNALAAPAMLSPPSKVRRPTQCVQHKQLGPRVWPQSWVAAATGQPTTRHC